MLSVASSTVSLQWLRDLLWSSDHALAVAHAVLIVGFVVAAGLAVGAVKIFRVSLGISGVLFAGLAFAHFGFSVDGTILEFAREFGLIMFVYTIGLQVGPGFLSSLRKVGLPLNLMSAAVVVLGVLMTLGVFWTSNRIGRPMEFSTAVGLLAGGTTNTPSLAAAQQAAKEAALAQDPHAGAAKADDAAGLTAQGYALAYPFGVVGIIVTMLLLRTIFRVDVPRENELFDKRNLRGGGLVGVNLRVSNPNVEGTKLGKIPQLSEGGMIVSRVLHHGVTSVAHGDLVIHLGDVLHVVALPERIEELKLLIGGESKVDVMAMASQITARSIVVTRREVIGKTIEEIGTLAKYGVTITRTSRAEVEIAAAPGWRFQFGDTVLGVGPPEALTRVAKELGDSRRTLEHPHFIGVFLGIALGVILGSVPVWFPGIPAPVRLGLAGGPLVVAIVLSRIGQIGPLTWYMPRSANYGLREFGISLFLACVGLKAGHGFVETLTGPGLYWMACAALITAVPLLTVGFLARGILKTNFVTLCGLLAGSMTDPPALQFANQMCNSESPSVAYATVYPLTMLLRVVAAQLLVLAFWH